MHPDQQALHEKVEGSFGLEYQNHSLSPDYSESFTEQPQPAHNSLQGVGKSIAPDSYLHPHDVAQSLPIPVNPQSSHLGRALDYGSEMNTRGEARRIHPIQSHAHTHHSFQGGYGPGVDPRIRFVGTLGALQTDPRHRLLCLNDERLVYFTSEVSGELEDVMVYERSHGQSHMAPEAHGLNFPTSGQSVHAAVPPNEYFELDGSNDRHLYTDSASLESYSNAIRSNSYGEVTSPMHNRDNDEAVINSIEQPSPSMNLDSSGNRNLKIDPFYRPHFRDILQARAYRNRARSTPQYLGVDDHTLPYVRANIHGFVAQLYAAMKNVDGVRDETTSTGYKRFVSHYHKDIDVEARCWEVVVSPLGLSFQGHSRTVLVANEMHQELCIDLHEHGYRLDDEENLAHHSPRDQDLTCASRLEELCHILRVRIRSFKFAHPLMQLADRKDDGRGRDGWHVINNEIGVRTNRFGKGKQ